ncbi:MAG: hypothetical protein ACTSVG_03830 [Alphaproteobacteria bacterium]
MAEFKKVPDSESGGGLTEVFDPELLGQIAATYWPAVLGGITLFVLILIGKERAAIPVAAAIVLLQAWRWGLFG